jgi:hypothetical protein
MKKKKKETPKKYAARLDELEFRYGAEAADPARLKELERLREFKKKFYEQRKQDLETFYKILNKLERKIGGYRYLSSCNGQMNWPRQGGYFFFEDGEFRENSSQLRVVRVGTHAVSNGSKSTLWGRLRSHRGTLMGKHKNGGNHRGSIFRLHIGTALINKYGLKEFSKWGIGSSASSLIRNKEVSLEVRVSKIIGSMPFLWLKAEDKSGPNSVRKFIERNAVALLSNYDRQPIDPSSEKWLGNSCSDGHINRSGLWNIDHVDESYNPGFLNTLEQLVDAI